MSAEGIAAIVAMGPWVMLAIVVVAAAQRIESGRWLRAQHHIEIVGTYRERLVERDRTIERQNEIIDRLSGVSDGALHVAESLYAESDHDA